MGGSFDSYLSRAPQPRTEGSSGAAAPPTVEISHPEVLMLRLLGNEAATRLLQKSLPAQATTLSDGSESDHLRISHPADPAEQEASALSRVLARVLEAPDDTSHTARLQSVTQSAPLSRCLGGCGSRPCDDAAETDHDAAIHVRRALATPGVGLDPVLRRSMGRSLGTEFPQAVVHDDPTAHRAAAAVQARAFTVGRHIVFGADQYAPETLEGRELLAHELVHVVQRPGNSTLYRSPVRSDLLTAGSQQARPPMRGADAHRNITSIFIQDVGAFNRLRIPSGARAAFEDSESCSIDAEPTMISPLAYNDNPRSTQGHGVPDLIHRKGAEVELAEIKPATWSCVQFGEVQVANYVAKGNGDKGYGSSLGMPGLNFGLMPPSRWPQLPYHLAYGEIDLTWDWCGQGVIGYLAVRRDDASTLICALKDAGKIDAFLQRTLGSARQVLDQTINTELNLRLARLIDSLSLEQLLESALGRAAARRILQGFDERLRRQLELQLRSLIHEAKDRLVADVSARLRARLRELLAELLAAMCVGAAVLTVDELLRRLRGRLRQVIWEEALLVAQQTVEEAMRTLTTALAAALVLALASLLIAILIADDASLIGILDDAAIAPLAGAVAWATRILAGAAEALAPILRTLLTATALPAAAASVP